MKEEIKIYDLCDEHGTIFTNSKAAGRHVTLKLSERKKNIIVFNKYYDKMVDYLLGSIDQEESGYIFFASELVINPVENCMVPKHRLATDAEKEELANRSIPSVKLPKLLLLDPIRRWHNFERKSVVAIERHDGSMYYRQVV